MNQQFTQTIRTVEIAILTPNGVLMQMKRVDNNHYSMWGAEIDSNENDTEAAVNILKRDAGLTTTADALKHVNIYTSISKDENGNLIKKEIHRFILEFDHLPVLKIEPKLRGWIVIASEKSAVNVIEAHQSFIATIIEDLFSPTSSHFNNHHFNEQVLEKLLKCPR